MVATEVLRYLGTWNEKTASYLDEVKVTFTVGRLELAKLTLYERAGVLESGLPLTLATLTIPVTVSPGL